jgi:hypothetical protein
MFVEFQPFFYHDIRITHPNFPVIVTFGIVFGTIKKLIVERCEVVISVKINFLITKR